MKYSGKLKAKKSRNKPRDISLPAGFDAFLKNNNPVAHHLIIPPLFLLTNSV
jgi:hypothetical protein